MTVMPKNIRLMNQRRRISFSANRGMQFHCELLEHRTLLANTPAIVVGNRLNNSVGSYTGNGIVVNSGFISNVSYPTGMAYDSKGNLFVNSGSTVFIPAGTNIIKVYSPAGNLINGSLIVGAAGTMGAIAIDANDNIYIGDGSKGVVRQYRSDGTLITDSFVSNTGWTGGIAFDRSGYMYVVDYNGLVRKFDLKGNLVNGSLISGLVNPIGIAVDSEGSIYVGNAGAGTIGKYSANGSTINKTLISGLGTPVDINFDAYDQLFIPCNSSRLIAKYDKNGTVINSRLITGLNETYSVKAIPLPTSTVLSVNQSTSVFGQPVTLTASVSATGITIPSGLTASFYDGSTFLGNSNGVNGVATLNVSNFSVGTHSISAKFSDPMHIFLSSTSSNTLTQTVSQAITSTILNSSSSQTVYGQSITITATVSTKSPGAGVATGTVVFKDGSTTLGSATLNNIGVASLTTSSVSVGSHSITAVYAGDNTFKTSTSAAFSQVVNQAATTSILTSSVNSSIYGQSATFTGTITANAPGAGIPTGTVSFKEGTTVLGTGILNAAGIATFSTTTLPVGNHSITTVYEGDPNFTISTSNAVSLSVIPNTTKIDTFANDSSSITITFNKAIATTLLQINDSYSGSTLTEQADMIVTDSSNQPVKGSLIVAPDAKYVMFMKTGSNFANGTYTVRLRSSANAFRNATGELLDGNGDGVVGDDYTANFTISNQSRLVSIPDVVRGPGQALRVNSADLGIPVKLSDAQDVYSFNVSLNYDPNLLTVSDVVVPASLSSVLQISSNLSTVGRIEISVVAPNGLSSGLQTLFIVNGKVPDKAPYRSKAKLLLSNIHLYRSDKSEITTTIDQGIQLVSYIGDVTGDGRYNALDTLRIQRYLVNLDRWHAQFPLVDPVMVADITGDGRVTALDSLYLQRYLVNMPVTFLSAPPVTSVTQTTGLDPVIRLPKNLTAFRGQNIQVPVELQNTDPQAIQVNSFEVAIAIDPKSFKMLKIQSDATIRTRYDARKGILVIGGILPNVTLKPGESLIIAKLNLKVAGHAVATDYGLNLLDQARIGKEQYATSVNGGTLVLIPGPTSGANDSVDGVVKVVERQRPIVAGVRNRKYRFLRI